MQNRKFTTQEILESWNRSCVANDDVDQEAKDRVTEALELLIAKEQGHVVELPCKIKEPVFVIPTKENGLKQITSMHCLGYTIGVAGNTAALYKRSRDKSVPRMYQPSVGSFGSVWFLSYEAAKEFMEKHST